MRPGFYSQGLFLHGAHILVILVIFVTDFIH